MQQMRIPDPEGNGFYNMFDVGNFEYVDPIHKVNEISMQFYVTSYINFLRLKPDIIPAGVGVANPAAIISKVIVQMAEKDWNEQLKAIMESNVSDDLLNIFSIKSKNNQLKVLKNLTLTPDKLLRLIFHAWLKFDFTYSNYVFHHHHTGLDGTKLPQFAYLKENHDIISHGYTDLTNGQIRSAIEQRNVIVAKSIDKGSDWHCFFLTYKSVTGKEVGSIPHIHYISSAFGLTREQVLAQFKRKKYKLPRTPHIAYERNGDFE